MAELVLQSVSSVLNDALRTLVQERLQEVVDLETLKKRVHEVVDLAFDDLHSDTLERAEMVIAMALSSNEAASRGAGNHHGRDELDNDASQRLVQSSATRAALRCAAQVVRTEGQDVYGLSGPAAPSKSKKKKRVASPATS